MFSRLGRQLQLFLAAFLWAAIAIGPSAPVAATTTSAFGNLGPVTYGRVASGRLVDVQHLGPAASTSSVLDLPFLTRNPRAMSTLKASATTSAAVAPAFPQTILPQAVSTPLEEELTVFPAMSLQQQVAALPNEGRQPPDTQIAAGPGLLMEMDNRTGSFWTKAGLLATTTGPNPFDLQPFFVPAPGPPSCPSTTCLIFDPRLLFDALSGRWLASAAGLNPATASPSGFPVGTVFFAVSSSSDPTGTWKTFAVAAGLLTDTPVLGVSQDKVVLAWSDYYAPGFAPCVVNGPPCFAGQDAAVIDKGQLLAGMANPTMVRYGPGSAQFGFMAVQSLTSSTTAYLVYNNADPTFLVQNQSIPSLGLIAITGTPSAGNVAFTESDLPLASGTIPPPDAVQMGSSKLVQTDDDRLDSATWQNGMLWTSAAIGCGGLDAKNMPKGACLRMWQISTGGLPTVAQDLFLLGAGGGAGDYFYYPAQSVDSLGNMYLVFSHSNAATFPGAMITGQPLGSASGSLTPLLTLQDGQGPYDPIAGGCGTRTRWGDYAAAAQDPTDPTDVWVGTEYTPSATNSCLWGTTIGRLTFSGPSISSAAPLMGSKFGGTSVVINGRDFVPGGTSVVFGQTPSTTVSTTPDQITVTSPAHLAATVPITVSTANGMATGGQQFTFLPRMELATGVSPATALPSRPAPLPVPQTPPGPRPLVASEPPAPTPTMNLTQPVWFAIEQAVLRLIAFLIL